MAEVLNTTLGVSLVWRKLNNTLGVSLVWRKEQDTNNTHRQREMINKREGEGEEGVHTLSSTYLFT